MEKDRPNMSGAGLAGRPEGETVVIEEINYEKTVALNNLPFKLCVDCGIRKFFSSIDRVKICTLKYGSYLYSSFLSPPPFLRRAYGKWLVLRGFVFSRIIW